MIKLKYPVILGSKSPRRQELLSALGIPFTVQIIETEEIIPEKIEPAQVAVFLANLKGEAYHELAKNHIVITADTVVIYNGKILGKPNSAANAKRMLQQLANRTHKVMTGVSVRAHNKIHSFDVSTSVTFGALTLEEIEYYVASGNANDKAGAYGIQDWIGMMGISSIEGSYYNVMGLPTSELYNCLKKHFL